MRAGSAGAATLRHVGLVALEATLVATLVWIAAMTLAGAGQSNDLVGAANAGRDPGTRPREAGRPWRHGPRLDDARPGRWLGPRPVRPGLDAGDEPRGPASIRRAAPRSCLAAGRWTSGAADCLAQVGWFTPGGHWRAAAETAFRSRADRPAPG